MSPGSARRIISNQRLGSPLFYLFAFCILAVSVTFFALSIGRPYMGASLSLGDSGWQVESVDAFGMVRLAGIRAGDRLVEINGQPAEEFLARYTKNGVVFGRALKDFTVLDKHGKLISVSLADGSLPWQSVTNQMARLAVSLISWTVGFYVLWKRPWSAAARLVCLSWLVFGLALSSNMAAGIAVRAAYYLQIITIMVGPWLLLHFFLVLPGENSPLRRKPFLRFIYLPPVVALALFFVSGQANGQPVQWFRTVSMLEAGAGFLAVAGVAGFNYFRAVSVRTRQQMQIMLISCLAALLPFLALSILPQAIWRQSILPPELSILLVVFVPLGMGYAIVKRNLMDIDIVIRRSIVYGLVTMVMALVLSVAIIVAVNFRRSLEISHEIALALVLGGVAAALFGPVREGAELLVDKLFYKDRYDYRQIIQSLSGSLNSVKDLTDVSRLLVGTTVHTLNLSGGVLFVKAQSGSFQVGAAQGTMADTAKQGQLLDLINHRQPAIEFPNSASSICHNLAYIIPLVAGGKEIGILCLSQKASRQNFSSGDIYLLQGIASVAATVLHSAMLIRDVSIRDTFVSVASHELRTPLTSVMGYAELLLNRHPPEDTRKRWLRIIFESTQRLTQMVDDLLNVTRIQSGKVSIKLEEADLGGILEEALSLARESTDEHEFLLDIAPDLPDALVDHDKFAQVVGNLISNAVKYSPNGGTISVSAHNDRARQRIVVKVADQGMGINAADKALLFTTFHRIQRPETQGIRGSGLGLYIAKEWTEAMGGEIWLESELDKGSTFFIAVPWSKSTGDKIRQDDEKNADS